MEWNIVSNMSNQVIASAKECETQWQLAVWCLYLLLRWTNIMQSGLYVYMFLVTLFCTLGLVDCVVWWACDELTLWQVDRVTSWSRDELTVSRWKVPIPRSLWREGFCGTDIYNWWNGTAMVGEMIRIKIQSNVPRQNLRTTAAFQHFTSDSLIEQHL